MGRPASIALLAFAVAVWSLVLSWQRGPGTLNGKHPDERQV